MLCASEPRNEKTCIHRKNRATGIPFRMLLLFLRASTSCHDVMMVVDAPVRYIRLGDTRETKTIIKLAIFSVCARVCICVFCLNKHKYFGDVNVYPYGTPCSLERKHQQKKTMCALHSSTYSIRYILMEFEERN